MLLGVVGLVAFLGAADAAERFVACPPPLVDVAVASQSIDDRRAVCAGAGDALAFFRERGLTSASPIRVTVAKQLPEPAPPGAGGWYDERARQAFLLSYERFRRSGTWFRVPIDRSMYRSAATHEVAHALAAGYFAGGSASIRAKEYVAYVVMFASMTTTGRARILHANPDAGFGSADRLSLLLYLFDPMRFGVESWRHYARAENGDAFLARVLDGRELVD
ncbi:MAG TPA: DUF6639 family protein [Zeimonas sp.]